MQRKFKIDWTKPDEVILERYKEVFPEQDPSKLLDNIKYQKLIYEKTSGKPTKRAKESPTTDQ